MEEWYELRWPGKKEAKQVSTTPTNKSFKVERENSIDFDTTKNLFIEGDNLDALKLLQKDYRGKIKLIYIDPPYNTRQRAVYGDDFSLKIKDYKEFTTKERDGRLHKKWLDMIYPRLLLAYQLLKDDGLLFISIDDREIANLKIILNELFQHNNYLSTIVWERTPSTMNHAKHISTVHEYILVYAKNKYLTKLQDLPRTNEIDASYKNKDGDPRGPWTLRDMHAKRYTPTCIYPIERLDGTTVMPSHGCSWQYSKESYEKLVAEDRIVFTNKHLRPRVKHFLKDVREGLVPKTLWNCNDVGSNTKARKALKKLFNGKGYFDGPKPISLIERIIHIANLQDNDIVFDFFAGSGTTAEAVFQYNASKGTNFRFFLVQKQEPVAKKSAAFVDGYKYVSEISKQRITLAGEKAISEESHPAWKKDVGFRFVKVI